MNLENQKVEHIKFGMGIIIEAKEQEIWVQFQDNVGVKSFQFPEAFENFLKPVDQIVGDYILEELRIRKEQIENQLLEEEIKAAELRAEKAKLEPAKKKPSSRSTKKKILS